MNLNIQTDDEPLTGHGPAAVKAKANANANAARHGGPLGRAERERRWLRRGLYGWTGLIVLVSVRALAAAPNDDHYPWMGFLTLLALSVSIGLAGLAASCRPLSD